jgi:DNA-binding MarR family transcriptional regulator
MPDAPAFSPTIALLILSRQADVELARLLEPHGLSLRTYGILSTLARMPGTSTAAIARRAELTVDDLRPMLKRLQDAGLTRPGDERGATVTLTPAGATLLAELAPRLADLDARFFAGDRADLAVTLATATAEPVREPQD